MDFLLSGVQGLIEHPEYLVMYAIGALLIYLAIAKDLEPALLLPMGFGAILVNLPASGVLTQQLTENIQSVGIIEWLFNVGIEASEAMPLLLFIGIGAMIDFGPLLANPKLFLFGAAAQFGIFAAIFGAALMGFDLADAASIGIIGAADGPTAILVSQVLNSSYMGPIAVVAYSYMALVPIVQPIVIKALTTKNERKIKMPYTANSVSQRAKIMFPIIVTFVAGLVAPTSVALVGFLMFGNLLRECGVLGNLSDTAQNVLSNLVTLLLGITISFSMKAEAFVNKQTLLILIIGLAAFVFDTAAGVLFAKLVNVILGIMKKDKINPIIGAAGISAFPMASRVSQKLAMKEDPTNILIMQATGVNVSGQIASVIAGGVILSLVPMMLG